MNEQPKFDGAKPFFKGTVKQPNGAFSQDVLRQVRFSADLIFEATLAEQPLLEHQWPEIYASAVKAALGSVAEKPVYTRPDAIDGRTRALLMLKEIEAAGGKAMAAAGRILVNGGDQAEKTARLLADGQRLFVSPGNRARQLEGDGEKERTQIALRVLGSGVAVDEAFQRKAQTPSSEVKSAFDTNAASTNKSKGVVAKKITAVTRKEVLPSEKQIAEPALNSGLSDLFSDAASASGGTANASDLWKEAQWTRTPREEARGPNSAPRVTPSLQEVFPGLHSAPGASILAPADAVLGLSGLAEEANYEAANAQYQRIYDEARALDPHYTPTEDQALSLQEQSWEGRSATMASLRADLAALTYRRRGEYAALQVETLGFMQRQVDAEYALALQKLGTRRLRVRLSEEEALGNFVDQALRVSGRHFLTLRGIDSRTDAQVRIQGREYDSAGTDRTYRVPDVRVGDVVFDATISRKDFRTAQVRGFFAADSRPIAVIIVRPTPLGGSYLLTRPTTLRRGG